MDSLIKDIEKIRIDEDIEEIITDENIEEIITDDKAESSTKFELGSTSGSTNQNDDEGSSCSKGSSQKQPICTDILKEMNEKYNDEFVVLKCENNEEVSVPVRLAVQSGMIEHALDVGMAYPSRPVPNVMVSDLEMVMEYWKMHEGEAGFDEEHRKDLNRWDNDFFTRIGPDRQFDLLQAANYLDARGLLDSAAQYVADLIKIMSVEEIRAQFNLTYDFTPEEEEQIKLDYPWVVDM